MGFEGKPIGMQTTAKTGGASSNGKTGAKFGAQRMAGNAPTAKGSMPKSKR